MREMPAEQIKNLLDEGKKLNFIDVREVDEVAEGKIPGAVNIPLGLLEARMHELDLSKEYIIVCRSGGRSGHAVQFLESHGYSAINMEDGIIAWEGKIEY